MFRPVALLSWLLVVRRGGGRWDKMVVTRRGARRRGGGRERLERLVGRNGHLRGWRLVSAEMLLMMVAGVVVE